MREFRFFMLGFFTALVGVALAGYVYVHQEPRRFVPILIYHYFRSPQYPRPNVTPGLANYYVVSDEEFEGQLAYLERAGFHPIPFSRLCEAHSYRDLPSRPVVLTFDHEGKDRLQIAVPALLRHHMTGTFFVTTGWIGRPGNLDENDLRRMSDLGMEIQSHTQYHSSLSDSPREVVDRELIESRKYLVNLLGLPVNTFSPPGGHWNAMTVEEAQKLRFQGFRTTDAGWGQVGEFAMPGIILPGHLSETEFSLLLSPEGVATNFLVDRLINFARRTLGTHYPAFRGILLRLGLDRVLLSPLWRTVLFAGILLLVLLGIFPRLRKLFAAH